MGQLLALESVESMKKKSSLDYGVYLALDTVGRQKGSMNEINDEQIQAKTIPLKKR